MVPRTEVVWLEKRTTVRDFYRIFAEHPHSRFPVFEGSQDNVVGIVGIKDVLRGVAEGQLTEDSSIDLAMRQAMFTPETKFVGTLFFEMQRAGHQMAVVVDEYGGTAGLVTLEMLLEELVGYVSDELRRHEDEFVTVDDRTFQIDAGMTIHDANQELKLALPEGTTTRLLPDSSSATSAAFRRKESSSPTTAFASPSPASRAARSKKSPSPSFSMRPSSVLPHFSFPISNRRESPASPLPL